MASYDSIFDLLNSGAVTPGTSGNDFTSMLLDPKALDRQRNQDLLMGLAQGFLQAGQPSRVPIDFGNALGSAIQGGVQATQGSYDKALKYGMAGAQLRNLNMQTALFPEALKALNQPSDYNPYGSGQPSAPLATPTAAPGAGYATTVANGGPGTPPESGGNYDAVNPASGAGGKYQFTAQTWADTASAHPDLKLPFNMKQATPDQQEAAFTALTQDNGAGLQKSGFAPTQANLYLAHRFGVSGAIKMIGAPDDAQIAQVLPPDWIEKNPDLQNKTVGQFKAGVNQSFGGATGAAGNPGPSGTPGTPPQVPGQPPIPVQPPDPAKYNGLRMMGGQWSKVADALAARDQQRYEAAKNAYDMFLKGQTSQREGANAAVNPDGSVNQGVVAATTAKKKGEMEATEAARTSTLYGGPGWQKKSPDELRKQANPELLLVTEGIQSGQIKMGDIGTRQSTTGITFGRNDVQALGRKLYGDGWDPNAGDRREKFMSDITDQDKQSGRTLYAVNTLYKHADQWQDLFLKIGNGDATAWNTVKKWLADNTGKSDYTTPEALSHAVGTELANAIKGQQLNMPEVEAAVDTLKTTQSPKQGMDAINALMHAMQARESTLKFAAQRAKVPQSYIDAMIDPDAKQSFGHFTQVQKQFRDSQQPQATPPQQPQPPAAPDMQQLSPEDAAKLPSGTRFIGTDGIPRVKH